MARNDFQCVKCGEVFHVEEGDIIRCPRSNGKVRCHGGGRRLPEHAEGSVAAQEAVDSAVTEAIAPKAKPLKQMNRAELNAKAAALGIPNPQALETNAQVIDAIQTCPK